MAAGKSNSKRMVKGHMPTLFISGELDAETSWAWVAGRVNVKSSPISPTRQTRRTWYATEYASFRIRKDRILLGSSKRLGIGVNR
jgi:hypothetical protein